MPKLSPKNDFTITIKKAVHLIEIRSGEILSCDAIEKRIKREQLRAKKPYGRILISESSFKKLLLTYPKKVIG
jgi:hypothetical protein